MTAKKATATTKKAAETAVASDPVKTAEPVKAEKPAETKAEPVKAEPAKKEKPAVTQNVYVQFAGLEISTADLTAKVTEEWVALGHRASSIKSLDLYVKPEDMAAYYVINGKESGKIAL